MYSLDQDTGDKTGEKEDGKQEMMKKKGMKN
jgi:hypothetical protein